MINYFKIGITAQQWKFPKALIGCIPCPVDFNDFCTQLAM